MLGISMLQFRIFLHPNLWKAESSFPLLSKSKLEHNYKNNISIKTKDKNHNARTIFASKIILTIFNIQLLFTQVCDSLHKYWWLRRPASSSQKFFSTETHAVRISEFCDGQVKISWIKEKTYIYVAQRKFFLLGYLKYDWEWLRSFFCLGSMLRELSKC